MSEAHTKGGFESYLKEKSIIIDDYILKFIKSMDTTPELLDSIMYSINNGGKRIRPVLTLETAKLISGDENIEEKAIPAACASEFMHTGSLIHDDLPIMDNDDYRRGKLSNHKVFGDATALIAGEVLMMLPFQLISEKYRDNPKIANELTLALSTASGITGMMDGQMIDLSSENREISKELLLKMQARKTGALLTASIVMGGIIGGADKEQIYLLESYGKNMGRLFQVTDDILDFTGDIKKLGKSPGSDLKKKKNTIVTKYGLGFAKNFAQEDAKLCYRILNQFKGNTWFFESLIEFLLNREY